MQKRDEVTGMSNMSNFKEICEKLSSQDPTIDRVYWSARAAVALPQVIDMIESLRSLLIESEALCLHLAALAAIDDSKATVERGTEESPKLVEIDNPMPIWKRLGFKDKKELFTMETGESP